MIKMLGMSNEVLSVCDSGNCSLQDEDNKDKALG